ncbi:MAG TPA: thymidine phosphorylase [Acidimicrobiales bacterium]|nr:thymidine phosphorylase [Acidimicrobiales bacterium]
MKGPPSVHDAVEVIAHKRDGAPLSDDEIDWMIAAYLEGHVAEEQMSALLMAIVWRGMERPELARLTRAYVESGERIDLSDLGRPTVDKHSTGGVGDKISLVLVPLVAACGAAVPQLSGRGLGHTGGTLDKLEAIPGFCSELSVEQVLDQLASIGCVVCAAGPGLAPADRRLYALRDVTATVESIPLIAASIMSKKIAEGTASLVLDVKVGGGAFMSDVGRASELARAMVGLGADHGVATRAVLSAMDTPLGRCVGNALEVAESLEVLDGEGPADVVEVTLALAGEMLALAGIDADPAAALSDGRARAVFEEMVAAQGGDLGVPLPRAPVVVPVEAPRSGVLTRLDARPVGVAAWRLGAGRARKEDAVSASAGVVCLAKPGEVVERGEPLLELHTEDQSRLGRALEALEGAFEIGDEALPAAPLVIGRIG